MINPLKRWHYWARERREWCRQVSYFLTPACMISLFSAIALLALKIPGAPFLTTLGIIFCAIATLTSIPYQTPNWCERAIVQYCSVVLILLIPLYSNVGFLSAAIYAIAFLLDDGTNPPRKRAPSTRKRKERWSIPGVFAGCSCE